MFQSIMGLDSAKKIISKCFDLSSEPLVPLAETLQFFDSCKAKHDFMVDLTIDHDHVRLKVLKESDGELIVHPPMAVYNFHCQQRSCILDTIH